MITPEIGREKAAKTILSVGGGGKSEGGLPPLEALRSKDLVKQSKWHPRRMRGVCTTFSPAFPAPAEKLKEGTVGEKHRSETTCQRTSVAGRSTVDRGEPYGLLEETGPTESTDRDPGRGGCGRKVCVFLRKPQSAPGWARAVIAALTPQGTWSDGSGEHLDLEKKSRKNHD